MRRCVMIVNKPNNHHSSNGVHLIYNESLWYISAINGVEYLIMIKALFVSNTVRRIQSFDYLQQNIIQGPDHNNVQII